MNLVLKNEHFLSLCPYLLPLSLSLLPLLHIPLLPSPSFSLAAKDDNEQKTKELKALSKRIHSKLKGIYMYM